MHSLGLLRLLQLASPSLPVGAYTYSQGLEWAVEAGIIYDGKSTFAWIEAILLNSIATFDAPLLAAALKAWQNNEADRINDLNKEYLAARESAELRAETIQMGFSLRRLAEQFQRSKMTSQILIAIQDISFPIAWAALACAWHIDELSAVQGYLWNHCESQVAAAVKLVPLGQSTGQQLLFDLAAPIPLLSEKALHTPRELWCTFSPGLAISSCSHETQYTRLFRS